MIWLELALIAFTLIIALFVALSRDVVGAVVTFAALTLGVSIIWVLLAAPDVALVEAAVGAGVTSVLFLIALKKTVGIQHLAGTNGETEPADGDTVADGGDTSAADGVPARESDDGGVFRSINLPAAGLVLGLAIPLGYTLLALPPVGATDAPAVSLEFADGSLTPYGYYVEQTVPDGGFPNAVVAVLVVYRGLDTLGELIVAFSAAVAVLVVLDREDLI